MVKFLSIRTHFVKFCLFTKIPSTNLNKIVAVNKAAKTPVMKKKYRVEHGLLYIYYIYSRPWVEKDRPKRN